MTKNGILQLFKRGLLLVGLGASVLALSRQAHTRLEQNISAALQVFGAPSVSVAIVENDKLTYAEAFGKADLSQDTPASTSTRYAIGSISKQFTAAAILLAQEAGRLSLDDKVAKFFPDPTRAKEVTIRQLLSHTSGYEDYAPQDYIIPAWTKPTTTKYIMDTWAKKPLNFDPGTKWQYSNTNYVIAGSIFEQAVGEKLVPFLTKRIFDPLGMNSAGEWVRPSGQDASAYTRFALGPPRPVAREGEGWYFAAGELSMTPSDLAKWDIAVLEHKILTPKSWTEMETEVKLKDGSGTHYGLGLSLREQFNTRTLSHGGEVSGFLASNTVFPKKHAAVIVFSNEDGLNMVSAISRELATVAVGDGTSEAKQNELVRSVLLDLQKGHIEQSLLSDNAQAYFTREALDDYQSSLRPLGRLVLLNRVSEEARGGMTHLTYRAHFEHNSVSLNIYLLPNGKIEQFLVEQQFSN
jgi:CubicO group peptidase (beta-lactamase class C family)